LIIGRKDIGDLLIARRTELALDIGYVGALGREERGDELQITVKIIFVGVLVGELVVGEHGLDGFRDTGQGGGRDVVALGFCQVCLSDRGSILAQTDSIALCWRHVPVKRSKKKKRSKEDGFSLITQCTELIVTDLSALFFCEQTTKKKVTTCTW